MRIHQASIAVATALAFSFALDATGAGDSCKQILPKEIATVLKRAFPDYELPKESDNLAEAIDYKRKAGDTGCLGVASGQFRGSSRAYAVLMTNRRADSTRIVVVFRRGKEWKVQTLRNLGPDRAKLYVDTIAPGTYYRAESIDGPPTEVGEVLTLTSKSEGIITGGIESSGVAYFFTGNRWQHVWVSD